MFKDFEADFGSGWQGPKYMLYVLRGSDTPHSLHTAQRQGRILGEIQWDQDLSLNVEIPISNSGIAFWVALSDGFSFRAVKIDPPAFVQAYQSFCCSIAPKGPPNGN